MAMLESPGSPASTVVLPSPNIAPKEMQMEAKIPDVSLLESVPIYLDENAPDFYEESGNDEPGPSKEYRGWGWGVITGAASSAPGSMGWGGSEVDYDGDSPKKRMIVHDTGDGYRTEDKPMPSMAPGWRRLTSESAPPRLPKRNRGAFT